MGFGTASDIDILKACIGGVCISIATTLNLGVKGQITGMSGTLNGIITNDKKTIHSKISLLSGMIITSAIFILAEKEEGYFYESQAEFQGGLSIFGFIFAGFFTGLGAKLQNGCTSGHGVCGLPRFSIRSIIAVTVFFCTALGSATIKYYGFPKYESEMPQLFDYQGNSTQNIETSIVLGLFTFILGGVIYLYRQKLSDCLVSTIVGAIFAVGLIISGMVKRSVIVGFLTINEDWNPSLMFVLMFACAPNFFTFWYLQKKTKKPLFGEKYCIPTNKKIDLKLVIGAVFFGLGWGIGGMCPGPMFCLIPTFYTEILFLFGPALVLGLYMETLYKKVSAKIAAKKKISPAPSINNNANNEQELQKVESIEEKKEQVKVEQQEIQQQQQQQQQGVDNLDSKQQIQNQDPLNS